MNYYLIEYMTKAESRRTVYVKAASEQLIPFSLRKQDRSFKQVISSEEVSLEKYEQAMTPKETSVVIEDQSYDDPSYSVSSGCMFLKNGKVNGKYVILDLNKVVEIDTIGMGGIVVSYPPMTKHDVVARHTEVVPYKNSEHKHLIMKLPSKKKESSSKQKKRVLKKRKAM